MTLLAIDPGLDRTGFAVFHLDGVVRPQWIPDACARMAASGSWDTSPAMPLEKRLRRLVAEFELTVGALRVTHVAIEAPTRPGAYARNARFNAAQMAQGIAYANMMPTLFFGAALTLHRVAWLIPASPDSKTERWQRIKPFVKILGRTNEDWRDAICLGVRVLSDARRDWGAEAATA